jgi:hypothetical protein
VSPDDTYGGPLGAFPYAIRESDSWLFRSYGLVGGLAALFVAVFFAVGVLNVIADTSGAGGGTFTLVRAFVILVALAAVGPLLAPVLLAARRHRHGAGDRRYDLLLALAGYGFLGSLYLGLLVSAPAGLRSTPGGPLGSAVGVLYGLPRAAGLAFPLLGALGIWLAHRFGSRRPETGPKAAGDPD